MATRLRGCGVFCAAAAVFVVVLATLLQLRFGYQAGTNDHLVLSLQGLQWGRPGFLAGDWFIASAPQPHVLFDLVTWAGAASGRLAEVYVAWWLLGLVAGGLATAVLALAWTPRAAIRASGAVAVLLGLGPQVALGTTTPALPTALPQELGGFLAYLTIALLLTRRPRTAAVAVVLTAVVHVQLGALVVVVGLLTFAVTALFDRIRWWSVLAGCVVATGVVVTILRLRPVASTGDDFVEICREVIPFHCDATTWSPGQLGSGFAVVGAALLSVAYVARGGKGELARWAAGVLAPALGLTLGVLANRYEVPVVGRLAQSTNIFRLAVLVVPFGAWGLIAGFTRLRARWRAVWLLVAVPAAYGWLVPRDGSTALPDAPHWALAVLGVGVLAVVLGMPAGRIWRWAAAVPALGAVALLCYAAVLVGTLRARPVDTTVVADPDLQALGQMVAAHVPVGEIVTAPPTLGSIRLTAGRSLLVDCKAVPYGGAAWRDYRARLDAIGGRGDCHSGGRPYVEVPVPALTAAMQRYGSRYLILTPGDRRRVELQALGWRLLAGPDPASDNLRLFAAPGAPDAAGGTVAPPTGAGPLRAGRPTAG